MAEEPKFQLRIAYIDVNYVLNQSKQVRELRKKQMEKEIKIIHLTQIEFS